MLGYASVSFFIGSAVSSFVSGSIVQWVPRQLQITGAMVVNICVGVTWLFWHPVASDLQWMLLVSGIQGMTHAVIKTLLMGRFSLFAC